MATIDAQVRFPTNPAEVPGPSSRTAMTREYVQMVGRMAYVWGYPMVNAHNRRKAFESVPECGLNGGVLPVAPIGRNTMLTDYIKPKQNFVACPNQDVVYGAGFYALDQGPIVFQVPDFGSRFWVYALYDARTDEFARIGKAYNTPAGHYLIAGPTWTGQAPGGINAVLRSSTELAFSVPRVFKDDTPEDGKAVAPLINQVLFYPLGEFDGTMKTKDWSAIVSFPAPPTGGKGEVKWVVPEAYFDQLPDIMRLVPPLPGEESMYGWIASVLDAAARNADLKKALVESAVATDKEIVAPLLQWRFNGEDAGNGWTSTTNNARWGTDYLNRLATARSNIYENTPEETKYIYRDFDNEGRQLDGNNLYSITFPKGQEPPVKGFWSLTLYNAHHLFEPNDLDRYSLGTKSRSLRRNDDGSLTLYCGAISPGTAKESNWLPAPRDRFSLYIRCYWPDASVIDGTWKAPQVLLEK